MICKFIYIDFVGIKDAFMLLEILFAIWQTSCAVFSINLFLYLYPQSAFFIVPSFSCKFKKQLDFSFSKHQQIDLFIIFPHLRN
jgi:hypothetical protein